MDRNRSAWELKLVAITFAIGLLYLGKPILLPLCLAGILYLLTYPVLLWMERKYINRPIGGIILTVAILCLLTAGITQIVQPASRWVQNAPEHIKVVEKKFKAVKSTIHQLQKTSESIQHAADITPEDPASPESQVQVVPGQTSFNELILATTGNILFLLFSTLILLYFFYLYLDMLLERATNLGRPATTNDGNIYDHIQSGITRYFALVSAINLCLGCIIAASMYFLDMPNPLVWGAMAAVFNFIPYIGFLAGVAIVSIVAFVSFDSTLAMAAPPITYFVINAIEGQFLTPILVGTNFQLNPLVVILSMMFWGAIWGVPGALLAVPVLAVVKIVCSHFDRLSTAAELIGTN